MIKLLNLALPDNTLLQLNELQRRVDLAADYQEKVVFAKRLFAQHNTKRNATFQVIRNHLTQMCSGSKRCGYCEDSAADEVEHIKPKDFYPEATFEWDNYLYACGPCNGPKNNQFAVFSSESGLPKRLERTRSDPIIAPDPGDPILINPRKEDPLVFMELDLIDTFYFLPRYPKGTQEHIRAEYTIEVLRLNDRDLLPVARREAYDSYRARLAEYVAECNQGMNVEMLNRRIRGLQRMSHPSVWKEMQRQQSLIAELQKLFNAAPEALDW